MGFIWRRGILRIAGSKSVNSRETTEGRIVEIIYDISKDKGLTELSEWALKAIEITEKFNEKRPVDRQVSPIWMGRKLKSLSLRKRQINGRSECIITQRDYKTLLSQRDCSVRSVPTDSIVAVSTSFSKSPTRKRTITSDG